MAYNQVKLAAASEDIKAKLLSGDSDLRKTAGLAASEYFRVEIRENGIRRQITPPTTVTKENFDNVEVFLGHSRRRSDLTMDTVFTDFYAEVFASSKASGLT